MVDENALIKAMETAWCITEEQCQFVKKIIEAYLEHARSAGTPSDVREARQLLDELLGQMALHYGEDSTQPIIMSKVYDFLHAGDKDIAALTAGSICCGQQNDKVEINEVDAAIRKDVGFAEMQTEACEQQLSPSPAVPAQAPIPRDNNATGNGDSTGYAETGRTEAKEP